MFNNKRWFIADRVFPLKYEKVSTGGSQNNKRPTPLDPREDGLLAKLLWLISDETNVLTDEIKQGIKVNANHDLVFFDRNKGEVTLDTLTSSSVQFIDGGNASSVYSASDLIDGGGADA